MQAKSGLEKTTQYVIFNREGFIMDSCNTLFPIDRLTSKKIRDIFPFIDSIFQELCRLNDQSNGITFRKIATKHAFLPGFYDYHFKTTLRQKKQLICWKIKDKTSNYHSLRKMQQLRQEATISAR